MYQNYSIIIPIHNEINLISEVLSSLNVYLKMGNEVIIIDDGSTDGTSDFLFDSNAKINLISLKSNKGKGYAIRQGLKNVSYDKVIIFDGDMEIPSSDIQKLMILDRKNKINFVMGCRKNGFNPLKSNFDWGNFMFTSFFNIIYGKQFKDILCCAKSFYLEDLSLNNLNSNGFDIDVELSTILSLKNKRVFIPQIVLSYNRRTLLDGKKLKVSDGWTILSRMIKMLKYL